VFTSVRLGSRFLPLPVENGTAGKLRVCGSDLVE